MINKKNIITVAVMAGLITGFSTAMADGSNSLLQMDVKKSSATDSVDVTFYTTANAQNSVVTRKSSNRYVVLLPNVSSSSSVAPSLGGVKDLITDVQVKNVDDGIGGYTKVTFETTKPVNIKSYMKKTSPLTQSQKDYKNLIAQNNKTTAQTNTSAQKTVSNTTKQTANTQTKPAVKNETKTANTQSTQQVKQNTVTKKTPVTTPVTTKAKTEQKITPTKSTVAKQPVQKTITKAAAPIAVNVKPVEQAQKVSSEVQEPVNTVKEPQNDVKTVENNTPKQVNNENKIVKENNKIADKAQNTSEKSNLIKGVLAGFCGIITLFAATLIFGAFASVSKKNSDNLRAMFKVSDDNSGRKNGKEYEDILSDNNLNWQEKYKKYTETDNKLNPAKNLKSIAYVTDMSATKQTIIDSNKKVTAKDTPKANVHKVKTVSNADAQKRMATDSIKSKKPQKLSLRSINKKGVVNNKKVVNKTTTKEDMQVEISRLEHSLSQTPKIEPPEYVPNVVRSEDDSIIETFRDIKLKSFAKSVTLKTTHRSLLEDEKKQSRNKSYREGRFVKLKNSPLSVSRRNSTEPSLEISDLMNTGNKYLSNNNGVMKMDKQKENYLLSSLDEYMTILDNEEEKEMIEKQKTSVANSLSQIRPSEAMSRSGITNPISKTSNSPYLSGLIVKSGYNIDSEKGFYIVNMDGVSALIGRINSNIFVLKKFDHVIDKPLQVRLDDGNVYIVKVGGFKCLVDVSKDKMGTLIEI